MTNKQITTESTLLTIRPELQDKIAHLHNKSDDLFARLLIEFKNGHSLSIVRGMYSYGGDAGLFEIMPSDASIFGDEYCEGEVMGYLTTKDVLKYIEKTGNLSDRTINKLPRL